MNEFWHFPIMILASFICFFLVLRIVLGEVEFKSKRRLLVFLAVLVILFGMLFGKYGAQLGLKWWIYYPIPMLMNILLPPIVLKMNLRKTLLYLLLSIISAPVIHLIFSLTLGWNEYMPFWQI